MSGLADVRIEKPTPLQNEVIPPALQGKHMLVKHEAGDDGVFLIPALQKLTTNGEVSGIRVLILTPSIERVKEIDETVWAMGYHAQISSAALSMKGIKTAQEEAIKDGAPVVVANPGRLIEILDKNKLKLPDVDLVIIDEAHGMENYNLVSRVKDIMQLTDGEAQTLIFSQSNNKATQQLTSALLTDPVVVGFDEAEATAESKSDAEAQDSSDNNQSQEQEQEQEQQTESKEEPEEFNLNQEEIDRKLEEASVSVVLNPEENKEEEGQAETKNQEQDQEQDQSESQNGEEPTVPEDLTQAYIYVPPRAKISTLLAHLEDTLTDKIVVFAASKRTTDRLFRIIRKKGWGVVSINEGLKEEYYNERFGKFTSGDMKILLVGGLSATEVELDEVKQVINYDVPNEVEEYKYRAELVGNGKAARMVSLVSKMDKDDIDEIVKKVGYAPTEIPLPEEVKEKKKKKGSSKKSGKKGKSSNNKNKKKKSSSGNDNRDRKRREKPKEKKSTNGLPRPSYDGLSGGKEGDSNGKRPKPSKSDGAFGWIKKLFD